MKFEYNFTSIGPVKGEFFDLPKKIYKLLKYHNYDIKLYQLKQLGAISHIYKGAHHTRHEYMLLQTSFINQFKLTTEFNSENLSIEINGKKPSKAEILQSLAILTNAAHFPDTYTASKLWLSLLEENKYKLRTFYRKGLCNEGKEILDQLIEEFDYYKIHLLNMVFLLNRYTRRDKEVILFAKNLLLKYLKKDDKALNELLPIYERIRKMSFILLDSNYAPIPFKLDFYRLSLVLKEDQSIIKGSTTFLKSLKRINELLQDTLYLSPETLLHRREVITSLEEKLNRYVKDDLDGYTTIQHILTTQNKDNDLSEVFGSEIELKNRAWDDNIIELKYKLIDNRERKMENLLKIEKEINEEIGSSKAIVVLERTPKGINVVCAQDKSSDEKIKRAYQIINVLHRLNTRLEENKFELIEEQNISMKLLKYILQYIFNKKSGTFDVQVQFEHDDYKGSPAFICNGSGILRERIKKYLDENRDNLNKSQMHEIETTIKVLEEIEFRGLILSYIGSTRVIEGLEYKAEFDGIISIPNKSGGLIYLIEAKKQKAGANEAKKQLTGRLSGLLHDDLKYSVKKFEVRDAYAKIGFN